MTLRVNEMFLSIQGESTRAGLPCGFVRLTGCPLRCRWCDTAYAYDEGRDMERREIVERALAWGVPLVEITGGEPLAQEETPALLSSLCDARLEVLLETSGALPIALVDGRVRIILDVKCPSSGESGRMLPANLDLLTPKDEVKFVVADRADYEYAREIIARRELSSRCPVILSPVFGEVAPGKLAESILADSLPVRLQLQLHKLIWPLSLRGK